MGIQTPSWTNGNGSTDPTRGTQREHAVPEKSAAKVQDERFRFMLTVRIDGDLRFISHLDTVRLFRRACARAGLPVRYSQGFNPQPRIALPLPRPVGVASDADAILIETEHWIDPADILKRLQEQTPAGISLIRARQMLPGERPQPDRVRYRLALDESAPHDLQERIDRIVQADSLPVVRKDPKARSTRTIDIRPYLLEMHIDGAAVEFTLRVTGNGTARPSELAELLGYGARSINHKIRRLDIQWR